MPHMTWLSRDYLKVELAFGADLTATPDEWSWTDVSTRLRESGSPQVKLSKGRPDEHGQTQPSNCSLTLDNDDGAFTPGNAASPHYPLVRRGVPIRVSLPDDGPDPKTLVEDGFGRAIDGAWGMPDTGIEWQTVHLLGDVTPSVDGSTGLLTLTGTPGIRNAMVQGTAVVDADMRLTVGLSEVPTGTDEQVQAEFYIRSRYQQALQFRTDGSIWARLDRADGPSDPGTVVTPLDRDRIVDLTDTGLTFTGSETYEVRIQAEGPTHRFRIWESGTAEPGSWLWEHDDDTYQAGVVGVGCWTGGGQTNDPLVWSFDDLTVTELSAPPLFLGQVVEWAPQWPSGDIGDYSRVRVVAGGVLRQQGQRNKQAVSAMRSGMSALESNSSAIAYWPCEDSAGATRMAPGFAGHGPLSVAGDAIGAAASPLETSEPLVQLNDGSLSGSVPSYSGSTHSLTMVFQVPSGGLTNGGLIARMNFSGGDLARADFRYLTDGEAQVTLVDVDDNTDSSTASSTLEMDGELLIVRCSVFPGPIDSSEAWGRFFVFYADSNDEFNTDVSFDDATGAATLSSTTPGRISSIQIGGGLGEAIVGHPIVSTLASSTFTIIPANGFRGESAVERFVRVSQDVGIIAAVTGSPELSSLMGEQRTGLALDILRECVEIDGGIMSELNTRLGLGYRARHTLYNQSPALTLDASAGTAGEIQNPFEPILNDLDIVNDVTVSRQDGSSARVLDQDSIDAEGRYDEQVTLNAHTDSQLEGLASWRLHLGTWGGMRYPTLSPALNAVASLIPTWVALDLGDKIRVEGLPSQHPAGSVDLLVQGTSDTLTPTGWDASANMSPEGPYHIATVGGGDEYGRIGSDGCEVAPGMLLDGTGDYASTPDAASLDITGDIDLRAEVTPADWSVSAYVVSKYDVATDDRSYALRIRGTRQIGINWSTDGASFEDAASTASVPESSGRLAIRATLDVDNGDGGWTVRFYTAPTIEGPWTQLGDPVTDTGTTSLFDGDATLAVGARNDGTNELTGVVHAAEVRDGIGGTVVADPDFTEQSTGATSFGDDAGNTWTLQGDAEIHGEFVSGTDTELVVASTGFPWINSTDHAGDFPFEVRAGGVVLEVTAVDVNAQIQTMTVTQAPVNGVTKTIPAGSAVQVAHPVYMGL